MLFQYLYSKEYILLLFFSGNVIYYLWDCFRFLVMVFSIFRFNGYFCNPSIPVPCILVLVYFCYRCYICIPCFESKNLLLGSSFNKVVSLYFSYFLEKSLYGIDVDVNKNYSNYYIIYYVMKITDSQMNM